MCGIIGYVGHKESKSILIDVLKKLEYRGYDSSGIALFLDNKIDIYKYKGKVSVLENNLANIDFSQSRCGIGHTRWATHGEVSDTNAHPHYGDKAVLVHNGIIENYQELKKELISQGHNFYSEVDSEVIAKLIDDLDEGNHLLTLNKLIKKLKGSYALAIMFNDEPNILYAIRKSSPLVIGLDKNQNYLCSDLNSLASYCQDFILLEEDKIARLSNKEVEIYNDDAIKIDYPIFHYENEGNVIDKENYEHFMLKEIEEQPSLIRKILLNNLEDNLLKINIKNLLDFNKIIIIGCGSAFHAGLIAKYYLEKLALIPVEVEVASEYRYKDIIIDKNTLAIFISQSGESADTLACLRLLKEKGIPTLSFVNTQASSIALESDQVIYTTSGVEVSVASTKALIGQITYLLLFALKLGYQRNTINKDKVNQIIEIISSIPNLIEDMLKDKTPYQELAKKVLKYDKVIFGGRGIDYYASLEGSLKFKEITYTPTHAYPLGELKHGPISLIDDKSITIVVNTMEKTIEKTLSNMQEIKARKGHIYLISNHKGLNPDYLLALNDDYSSIFFSIIFFQLISYYGALLKNLDVDKPRNLAKSVTVE